VNEPPVPKPSQVKGGLNSQNSSSFSSLSSSQKPVLYADGLKEVDFKKISYLQLDTLEFKMNQFQTGRQSFMGGSCPSIIFDIPEVADYVEIMRCSSNQTLSGVMGENLINVELGTMSPLELEKLYRSNDFWSKLQDSQGTSCVIVAAHYSPKKSKSYLDSGAPTGKYRYFSRSCADLGRFEGTEQGELRSCSRMLSFSQEISHTNSWLQNEQIAFSNLQKIQDDIEGKGRSIYLTTLAHNNALVHCEKTEKDRQVGVKRKQAINTILGFGISLGAEMFIPETGFSAVQSGTKTFGTLASEMWEERDNIMGFGNQIGNALNLLSSSSSDYPRSCTEAVRQGDLLNIQIQELKNLHERYGIYLDDVEKKRKAKEQMGG